METERERTRDGFLAAGVRLYTTMSDRFLKGFTAGAVAAEAGFRRQTFYRYWDTQADYVRDLIRHLLVDHSPTADGMAVLPSRRDAGVDWAELVRDIARYDYSRMAADARVTMRLGLWSMQATGDADLRAMAQDFYDGAIDHVAEAFESVLEDRGRSPLGPLSYRDLARVQQALLVGLLVQDPQATDSPSAGELYEEVFGPLLEALTKSKGPGDTHSPKVGVT